MRFAWIAVVVATALSCGSNKPGPAPKPAAQPDVVAAPETPKVAPQPQPSTPDQPKEQPAAAEQQAPGLDKEKLAKAYQEIYCAQKKGEMDKILRIYKNYGFDSPSEFTKVWIEAAKDTDWVTKVARDVGKKCQ